MEKNKTEFSELKLIRRPRWDWDPPSEIKQFLDKPGLIDFTKLQINFRIKGLEIQIEHLKESLKLI